MRCQNGAVVLLVGDSTAEHLALTLDKRAQRTRCSRGALDDQLDPPQDPSWGQAAVLTFLLSSDRQGSERGFRRTGTAQAWSDGRVMMPGHARDQT